MYYNLSVKNPNFNYKIEKKFFLIQYFIFLFKDELNLHPLFIVFCRIMADYNNYIIKNSSTLYTCRFPLNDTLLRFPGRRKLIARFLIIIFQFINIFNFYSIFLLLLFLILFVKSTLTFIPVIIIIIRFSMSCILKKNKS